MGKKSIKENKNIYQKSREALDLTREKAAELLEFISDDRIEKIESEKSYPHPDEIVAMAKAYKNPSLCNYYCANECPIGKATRVPQLQLKELSTIVLEILNSLDRMDDEKSKFINIAVDGKITDDEIADFAKIKHELDKISVSVSSLKLWINQTIADGRIDIEKLSAAEKELK
ncbi:MAG: helix-turn-helix domain-containing protein [Lachnospiraceae bacterium]|nr:helix-turn-helix domain-containing protein [Lachnospiraceae bacterium]